ncbi:MAG: hypothetical protein MZV70_42120 [Desulfobacterales bacterium]|nr:hypothetical protein [Desulfobacterales bacterium]
MVITRDGGKTVIKIVPSPDRGGTEEPLIYTPTEAAAVQGKTIVVSPQYSDLHLQSQCPHRFGIRDLRKLEEWRPRFPGRASPDQNLIGSQSGSGDHHRLPDSGHQGWGESGRLPLQGGSHSPWWKRSSPVS